MSTELNELIRDVADDYPQADPRELARHVAKLTPKENLAHFYEESLVPIVRNILISERTSALSNALNPSPKPRSVKLEQRRDYFAELCAARVHIGKSEWVSLGECGIEELRFCIAEREQDIARVREQITLFERLLSLLKKHKAHKVAALPREAVQQ